MGGIVGDWSRKGRLNCPGPLEADLNLNYGEPSVNLKQEMVTYRVSRIMNAPLKYAYDWCTDYREDDNKISGAKYPRKILQKTRNRAIYASNKVGQDGKPKLAARIVTLHPSLYSWHLDYFAEENKEIGEYKLISLGKNKTRLDMVFKSKWKSGKSPSKEEFVKETKESWERFTSALERDYNSGKKATAP